MAMAIGYEHAKTNQVRNKKEGNRIVLSTRFFGSRDKPDLPHASLNQLDPGHISSPHFHRIDQFQVVVRGKGMLGRHALAPYVVHFTRAYTPYGPLVSDADTGLAFFVMRAHLDAGSQHLPEELDQLKRVTNRQPFQITGQASFSQSGRMADAMLHPISGVRDDKGLAAYTLTMQPHAVVSTPDPSDGDGQYVVVVRGSLLQNNEEHSALALAFSGPREGPMQIRAGPTGLEALVLNFPRPQTCATSVTRNSLTTDEFKSWKCELCAFFYDEAAGLPAEGITPGTRWQDVPDTCSCPDCGASKGDFQMIEVSRGS